MDSAKVFFLFLSFAISGHSGWVDFFIFQKFLSIGEVLQRIEIYENGNRKKIFHFRSGDKVLFIYILVNYYRFCSGRYTGVLSYATFGSEVRVGESMY